METKRKVRLVRARARARARVRVRVRVRVKVLGDHAQGAAHRAPAEG